MESKKTSNSSYHLAISIIGMLVITGSQFFDREMRPYLIITTIAIMLIAVFFKIRQEIVDGVFDKTKYISAAWIILFSIGFFSCCRFLTI